MDAEAKPEKKIILILKSNPMSLQAAEQFLRARDWEIVSTTKLAEAIQTLFMSQVHYFLICANHPHKKVRVLPKVLTQARAIKIIVYTDIASAYNMSVINEMGIPYQIVPPVSGPSIERTIIRMEKELQMAKNKPGTESEGDEGSPNKSGLDASMREKFNFLLMPEGEEGKVSSDNNSSMTFSTTSGTTSSDAQSKIGSPSFSSTDSQSSTYSGSSTSSSSGSNLHGLATGPGTSSSVHGENQSTTTGSLSTGHAHSSSQTGYFEPSNTNTRGNSYQNQGSTTSNSESEDNPYAYFNHNAATSTTPRFHQAPAPEKPSPGGYYADPEKIKKLQDNIDSLFETKPQQPSSTLNDLVHPIGTTEEVLCLSVDSGNFKGFLVTVMANGRRIDDEFLMHIQSRLGTFFKNEGIPFNEDEPLEVKLKQVQFESWAHVKAEFLKKSVHQSNEVAMAFFPADQITPHFGEGVHHDMVSIDLDDLNAETQVSFDVYIYLPTNNKYILYTPKGGTLLQNQKERLKAKGVSKMHIKKTATTDAKRYHMENKLNTSIDEYQAPEVDQKKKA